METLEGKQKGPVDPSLPTYSSKTDLVQRKLVVNLLSTGPVSNPQSRGDSVEAAKDRGEITALVLVTSIPRNPGHCSLSEVYNIVCFLSVSYPQFLRASHNLSPIRRKTEPREKASLSHDEQGSQEYQVSAKL